MSPMKTTHSVSVGQRGGRADELKCAEYTSIKHYLTRLERRIGPAEYTVGSYQVEHYNVQSGRNLLKKFHL